VRLLAAQSALAPLPEPMPPALPPAAVVLTPEQLASIAHMSGYSSVRVHAALGHGADLFCARRGAADSVGFCGGFTTFSSFTNENITLLKDGNFVYFALYTSLSVFLGLMATYLGNLVTKIGLL